MIAVLAAEWTKIRTVRSTFWTLLLTFVLTVGLTYVVRLSFRANTDEFRANTDEFRANTDEVRNHDPIFAAFNSLVPAGPGRDGDHHVGGPSGRLALRPRPRPVDRLGIVALWTAAAPIGGYLVLRRRDA